MTSSGPNPMPTDKANRSGRQASTKSVKRYEPAGGNHWFIAINRLILFGFRAIFSEQGWALSFDTGLDSLYIKTAWEDKRNSSETDKDYRPFRQQSGPTLSVFRQTHPERKNLPPRLPDK